VTASVIDPHWVVPVRESVVDALREADLIVTVEDNGVHGGAGAVLQTELNAAGMTTPVRNIGIPQQFLAHAERPEVLTQLRLDNEAVTERVREWVQSLR